VGLDIVLTKVKATTLCNTGLVDWFTTVNACMANYDNLQISFFDWILFDRSELEYTDSSTFEGSVTDVPRVVAEVFFVISRDANYIRCKTKKSM